MARRRSTISVDRQTHEVGLVVPSEAAAVASGSNTELKTSALEQIAPILVGGRLKDKIGSLIFTINIFTGLPSYRLLKSVRHTLLLAEHAATSETAFVRLLPRETHQEERG